MLVIIRNICESVTSISFHTYFVSVLIVDTKYKMSIQCNVFSLALVLNDFVPLLCVLLSSVDVVQAECGGWSVWY